LKSFLSTLSADRLRSLWYLNEVTLNRRLYTRDRELSAGEVERLKAMQDAIEFKLGEKPPSLWELGEGPGEANG
jgi:hypothetical protein